MPRSPTVRITGFALENIEYISDLLSLQDLSVSILQHLPAKSLIRACMVCKRLRSMASAHEALLWGRLLQDPEVAPYVGRRIPSAQAFQQSQAVRRAWHCAAGAQRFVHLKSYVRSLRVDAHACTLVAGLSSGRTFVHGWGGESFPRGPIELKGRHQAQVLAVDFSLASGVCVSASGEPPEHQTTCRHAMVQVGQHGRLRP
jgi:hypothetical protein